MGKTNFVIEPGKQEIVMKRTFDAPRDLVFKTYTDPKLIPEWWGPASTPTSVDEMDVGRGGTWRFVSRDQDGTEYAFHGVYHDSVPAERLVSTFEFEGAPGHVSLETMTFEENDGKTTVTGTAVFQSVADRDAMVESGMEQGANETWDRFADLLTRV